jgi:hypothetical protein
VLPIVGIALSHLIGQSGLHPLLLPHLLHELLPPSHEGQPVRLLLTQPSLLLCFGLLDLKLWRFGIFPLG